MRRMSELPQLVGADPEDLPRSAADSSGAPSDPVDERVEAGPMAEDAVDQRRHEAPIATIELVVPQVLGEDPVREAAALLDLTENPNRDLAGRWSAA